jgi:cytochrome c oxidase subunit 3/cytochrome o ubiquinol oxidase subunit 3
MSSEKLHAGEPAHMINDPSALEVPWRLPSPRKVVIISLILTESALFTIFVVAYVFYMGKSLNRPYPSEVLEFPWLGTIALLGSSVTVIIAEMMLHRMRRVGFLIWWGITIAMGAYFVYFTGAEWMHLIYKENLTISTNVFGSTFYALVGLHLSHVLIGLLLLSAVWIITAVKGISVSHTEHFEMISWYWHFVDAIWIVVVTVVYIISVHY